MVPLPSAGREVYAPPVVSAVRARRPAMFPSLLMVVAASLVPAVAPPAHNPPTCVGQIFIVGNEVTPGGLILEQLPLYPGQVLSDTDLARAARSLSSLRLLGI